MNVSENLLLSRYDWAEKLLKECLPSLTNRIVLDIGTGDGRMKSTTERLGGKWIGFDIEPQTPEIISWNLDTSAPENTPMSGMILMLDVIEHLPNPWLNIDHISRLVIPNGLIILTMPNPRWSRSRLYVLKTGYSACYTQSDLDLNNHIFTTWPHIIEKLLHDKGFVIEKYVTLDGITKWPGKPINLRYPLRFIIAAINKTIEFFDPSACGMSYGILAKKIDYTKNA